MKKIILSATLSLVALTSSASATALNIDFGLYGEPDNSYGAASGQVGVWNGIAALGVTSDLVDLSGTATSASLNLTADTIGGAFPHSNLLIEDNFYSSNDIAWTLSLSGLDTGVYDIYYYAPFNGAVFTGTFTANDVVAASIQGANTLVEGASWAHLSNVVVDGSGMLNFASTSVAGYRGLAGLQIMGGTPETSVPEPAPLALLGFGLLGLGLARKRRG